MNYKIEYYLKRQFKWMISEKRNGDYHMMHHYEYGLNGAITALYYADVITDSEYHFLNNLVIRITCGKR